MKPKILIYSIILLLVFVFVSCAASEFSYYSRLNSPDILRNATGLPSIAIGNLSPASRNPGVEALCTGIYDVPGGYCVYFSMGVPYIDFPTAKNFTVNDGGR